MPFFFKSDVMNLISINPVSIYLYMPLHRYYLNKAKQISDASPDKVPGKFKWAFTEYGYKFIAAHQFKLENNIATDVDSMFSILTNRSEPLSFVMRDYREHLLERALQCLVGAGGSNVTGNGAPKAKTESNGQTPTATVQQPSQISDVLTYTQLLADSSQDYLSLWWSNLLSTAAYWLLGEDGEAEKLYDHVLSVPASLSGNADRIAEVLLASFVAKKNLL